MYHVMSQSLSLSLVTLTTVLSLVYGGGTLIHRLVVWVIGVIYCILLSHSDDFPFISMLDAMPYTVCWRVKGL